MRVRAITPIHVDSQELARRQQRYDRLAPEGVTIRLDDLGSGAGVPRALETEADVRRSEDLVIAEIRRTDPDDFDAVLPDCVLDPGVGMARDLPLPVFGLLRLSTHLLAASGQRFAGVARNDAIAAELRRKVSAYALESGLVDVRVLGLAVGDIPDDATWAGAIGRTVADLEVGYVINGCSAVEVMPSASGPGIVDPTATALRVLGLLDQLGLAATAANPVTR